MPHGWIFGKPSADRIRSSTQTSPSRRKWITAVKRSIGVTTIQRALSMGVPLVVTDNTEDKPEVAARVAWTGAGVNLRTGTPTPGAVRAAVREVLTDGRYLGAARMLEAAFARRDGVAEIAALVDEVIIEEGAVEKR